MALTKTEIGGFESSSAFGTGHYQPGPFTPPNDSLLVVVVGRWRTFGSGSADIGEITITDDLGTPLTYNQILREYLTADAPSSFSAYYAEVGTAEEMSLDVVDATGESMGSWLVGVWAFENYDPDTLISGATTSGTTSIGSDSDTRTLTEAPAADDYTIFVVQNDVDGTTANVSWGGFTQSYELNAAAGYGVVSMAWRTGSTDTSCAVTDTYTSGSTFYKASSAAFTVKANPTPPQDLHPDADVTTTGWSSTPLWSKIEEVSADGTVITATAS